MESLDSLLNALINKTYVKQGIQNEQSRYKLIRILLHHKKLPLTGWNDLCIEQFIQELSSLDCNNFMTNAGVGEREGRVYSTIVAKRNCYLSHGIGRSGDIMEVQPKAAGSSIIYKLTTSLVMHAIEIAGITSATHGLILPFATGMSLTMCFLSLMKSNKKARYIIWSRIDQKSCFKSILTAGMIPLIVENILIGDEMKTNIQMIKEYMEQYKNEILCVLSTTSCFAPRQPDNIDEIALLCKDFNINHVINNAYGLQCPYICKLINRAINIGRVDAVIQSTDKNFMVPVGGAIIISSSKSFIETISSTYPGRASINPILDLFITLLSMGEQGYRKLLTERKQYSELLCDQLNQININGSQLKLLTSPRNTISIGVSLDNISYCNKEGIESTISFIGSMLFQRNVSGCRVINSNSDKVTNISGYEFKNWGSHCNNYPSNYFTVACSIGIQQKDITLFTDKLDKVLNKCLKSMSSSPINNNLDIKTTLHQQNDEKNDDNTLAHSSSI